MTETLKWTKICLANWKCQSTRKQQVKSRTHEQSLNEVGNVTFDVLTN